MYLYIVFEYKKDKLEKATAYLRQMKYKKNVPVYGRNFRLEMIIKHWSKSVYEYKVNDKEYKIRYHQFVTPRQMPYVVPILYFKKFPKIAYVNTNENFNRFWLDSLLAFFWAILGIMLGMELLSI